MKYIAIVFWFSLAILYLSDAYPPSKYLSAIYCLALGILSHHIYSQDRKE